MSANSQFELLQPRTSNWKSLLWRMLLTLLILGFLAGPGARILHGLISPIAVVRPFLDLAQIVKIFLY